MISQVPPTRLPSKGNPLAATLPSLVVVLSRGHLKAYEFDQTQHSGLRLIDEVEFYGPYDWHHPVAVGEDRKAVVVTAEPLEEPTSPESETDLGALRRIALAVGQLLIAHQPAAWWYAAPGDVHDLVLDLLDESFRTTLSCQVRSDLTDVPSRKLRKHFELAPRPIGSRQSD